MKVSTFISGTSPNDSCALLNKIAIRTHQETTEGLDCEFQFWDHDTENEDFRKSIISDCNALGVKYVYREDPYHATKWMNEFFRTTNSDFVVWATADCVFFHGWLQELVRVSQERPELFTLHPFTFDSFHYGHAYSNDGKRKQAVIETNTPLCHVIFIRRDRAYVWDEQFFFYEADMDFHCWLSANNLQSGMVLSSRVDHLSGSIMRNASSMSETGSEDMIKARRQLEAKWNLPAFHF